MTEIKPSQEFPTGSFPHAVANAVMAIICENIPALKGRNLQTDIEEHYKARREDNFGDRSDASAFAANFMSWHDQERLSGANLSSEAIDIFQNRLTAEISREIRAQGDNFRYLNLYIRDPYETSPGWLKEMIEAVAEETEFDLHDLMPYREKIAITIHNDGEIFWGTSGYGSANATERLEDYVGKPGNSLPFVNINNIQPDAAQAYTLDLGRYRPIVVPDDEPQEADTPNHWTKYRTTSITHQVILKEILEKDDSGNNPSRRQNNVKELAFLRSLLAMWDDQCFEGYPDYRIAFVPENLTESLSENDFDDRNVLRRLKNAEGTIMHSVRGWECPVTFTSPHQYEWDHNFLYEHLSAGQHKFSFIDEDLACSFNGNGGIRTIFRQEDGHFRLITSPFYLSKIATPIQTGVGINNMRFDTGDRLAFTVDRCPIGKYTSEYGQIFRWPEAALPYLRAVKSVPQPFNHGKNNTQHFFGVSLGSTSPDLDQLPTVQLKLKR